MSGELALGPITLFFSYSHKDESLRDELAKHLTTLQQAGFIREWHDRQILPGEEWDRQISIHLEKAEIILLLISADFLASKYCYDIEAKRALERHTSGTVRVIPVILRPVVWKLTPFHTLEALPDDARAVTEWRNRDLAFVNICEGILAIVVAWKESTSRGRSRGEIAVDRRVSPKIERTRKRVLDAALPRRIRTGKATTLVVMLRREGSPGLRAIVEMEASYGVQKEDVRSTETFRLDFPVGANGKLSPLELELEIRAPDFAPTTQREGISVPPTGDSKLRVFLLTPQRQGELVLIVLLRQGDRKLASCLLRTNAEASEGDVVPGGHSFVSIPLDVGVDEDSAWLLDDMLKTSQGPKRSAARKESGLERCENGHLYDRAKRTGCPYCGVADLDFGGKTHPRRPATEAVSDEPEELRTRPKEEIPRAGGDPAATQGIYRKKMGIDPVVGWLVCVEGEDRGRDFPLRSENNFVGRSEKMDICITGDECISRENYAVITFDPLTNGFYLRPGEVRKLVFRNGHAVFEAEQLQPYDEILLGKTRLRFVPLCGDRFKLD